MTTEPQSSKPIQVDEEIAKAAKLNPNGWVYKLDTRYGIVEDMPVEGIIGWWKVDAKGDIDGGFVPNPRYKPWRGNEDK